MNDEVSQMLGRIDGKLDQVIDAFKEHKDDDKRRFAEVYGALEHHAADINQAKGAKTAILAAAGLIGAVVSFLVSHAKELLGK